MCVRLGKVPVEKSSMQSAHGLRVTERGAHNLRAARGDFDPGHIVAGRSRFGQRVCDVGPTPRLDKPPLLSRHAPVHFSPDPHRWHATRGLPSPDSTSFVTKGSYTALPRKQRTPRIAKPQIG